jgi:hypothetical protein
MSNTDIDIIDTIDLINYTISDKFIEQWRHKYSIKFLKQFQFKLLDSFQKRKPIKIDSLFTFFVNKNKYSPTQVTNFFKSIDIDLYSPIIYGKPKKFTLE